MGLSDDARDYKLGKCAECLRLAEVYLDTHNWDADKSIMSIKAALNYADDLGIDIQGEARSIIKGTYGHVIESIHSSIEKGLYSDASSQTQDFWSLCSRAGLNLDREFEGLSHYIQRRSKDKEFISNSKSLFT